MELDILSLILAVVVGFSVFLFGFFRKFNEWYYVGLLGKTPYPLPPGDMGWPLFGNMTSFLRAFNSTDPDSFIYNLVSRYGRIGMYKSYLFGSPSIIVCTAETCRKVMTDDEKFMFGYPEATKVLAGRKSLCNIPNSEHRWLRRLTTGPIKGDGALSLYIGFIEDVGVSVLDEWAAMDKPVELLTELRKVAFKVIAHIFMGSGNNDYISNVEAIRDLYIDIVYGLKSHPINLPGFPFYKALQARKKLVKIIRSVLENKKKAIKQSGDQAQEAKKDMMDLFVELKDEDGRELEDEHIIDLLQAFFLAGHESSAHTIVWAIINLTENPETLRIAKEEQKEIINRRPPTQKGLNLKEIKEMRYLSKVIDETLRIASFSFANFREAKVDVNLNGYMIPKGWKVCVWSRGIHMDPETYQNPKEFNPERWDNYIAKAGSFIPFGAGSRLCPGADLAKLEISIFLHHFLLYYKVERLNPKAAIRYLPLIKPSDNCLARIMKVSQE